MKRSRFLLLLAFSLCLVFSLFFGLVPVASAPAVQQVDDSNPPGQVVKLVFIHHSSGENWLADENGGLGLALQLNNYFVSDTNYGWGPAYDSSSTIGDHTDIPDWLSWFHSDRTPEYMQAVFTESEPHASYTRLPSDPGGENQIIMFKSCFPNSNLEGRLDDPAAPGDGLTVSNAKYVYNEILKYFATRPDKFFIVITAPPLLATNTSPENAANARAFNNWLVDDWLAENNYTLPNVAVFDFYNVLTGPDNYHRFIDGKIEHVFDPGHDTAYYPSTRSDDHPSVKGNRKATEEFLPLLNIYYHRWQVGQVSQSQATSQAQALSNLTQIPEEPTALPAENPRHVLPCIGGLLPLALAVLVHLTHRK